MRGLSLLEQNTTLSEPRLDLIVVPGESPWLLHTDGNDGSNNVNRDDDGAAADATPPPLD